MKAMKLLSVALVSATTLAACAHTPPGELTDVRQSYKAASGGLAAQEAPAELFEAKKLLDKADRTFADDGNTPEVRHFALLADRQIRIANAVADQRVAKHEAEVSSEREKAVAAQIAAQRVREAKAAEVRADIERDARIAAEKQAEDAKRELERVARVAEEERGLVISMQGGILFPSGGATLLPGAVHKLDRVAAVLLKSPERTILVEGHTDSAGSSTSNLALSRERAEAVRGYLVSRGVPANRISAAGLGEERPIASNTTTTGRAENRRVEIVLQSKPTAMLHRASK